MTSAIANIAAYKFVALNNLTERRVKMRELCQELQLKGTVLLSTEGINLFLAGQSTLIDQFLDRIRSESGFADLDVKISYSDEQPFRRLLIKIKKEAVPSSTFSGGPVRQLKDLRYSP